MFIGVVQQPRSFYGTLNYKLNFIKTKNSRDTKRLSIVTLLDNKCKNILQNSNDLTTVS